MARGKVVKRTNDTKKRRENEIKERVGKSIHSSPNGHGAFNRHTQQRDKRRDRDRGLSGNGMK